MAAQASVLSTPFAGVSPAVARSRAPARAYKVVVASRGYPRTAPVSLATARRPQSLSAGIPVVRVRFAARPGAVRASVKVYAEADVYDPTEVSQTPQYRELNRVSVEIQPVPGATFPRGARRGALPGVANPKLRLSTPERGVPTTIMPILPRRLSLTSLTLSSPKHSLPTASSMRR